MLTARGEPMDCIVDLDGYLREPWLRSCRLGRLLRTGVLPECADLGIAHPSEARKI
jgi:hypothetical protein